MERGPPPRAASELFWDALEQQQAAAGLSSPAPSYSELRDAHPTAGCRVLRVLAREVVPAFGPPWAEFSATILVQDTPCRVFRRTVTFRHSALVRLHSRLLGAQPWSYLRSLALRHIRLLPMSAAARAQTAPAVEAALRALIAAHPDSAHVLAFLRTSRLTLSPAHGPSVIAGWAQLQLQHNNGVLERQPWRIARGGCSPNFLFQAYRGAVTLLGFYALLTLLGPPIDLLFKCVILPT
ncbi:hypothetical protein T492DRAFT_888738 [Pavlovales sp. CCMP2436]|nr:hypothetical protein T492DRAFT_888738 [Pavlovales sp. CCMP2436]